MSRSSSKRSKGDLFPGTVQPPRCKGIHVYLFCTKEGGTYLSHTSGDVTAEELCFLAAKAVGETTSRYRLTLECMWSFCVIETLKLCVNSSLSPRHHSPVPCFVCSVQSTGNLLVQSQSHFHHRSSLHSCTPLLYEVNLFFCLTQCSLRWNTVSISIQAMCWFYT